MQTSDDIVGLAVTLVATAEPVSLGEAKLHCRVDPDLTADDSLIDLQLQAAREYCEAVTGRQFVTATWVLSLPGFPCGGGEVVLPKSRLRSVTSVVYEDPDGDTQTLGPANYVVRASADVGRITLAAGASWPATLCQADSVRVTFVAGYGAASAVPASLKQAILLLVGHWYLNREAVGQVGPEMALAVGNLLAAHWDGRY